MFWIPAFAGMTYRSTGRTHGTRVKFRDNPGGLLLPLGWLGKDFDFVPDCLVLRTDFEEAIAGLGLGGD